MTKAPYLKIEEIKETSPVYDLKGKRVSEIPLPRVFNTPVREDLIRKVFLALRTSRLQPKGVDPLAGKRTTAESWGVGYGVARVPRIKGSTRAAFVPMAVGGRRAHPPVTTKRIRERINRKEKRAALMSAIAATAHRFYVEKRGHMVGNISLPIIVVDELQSLKRTREVREFLESLGLWKDVERARRRRRIRAGKGKMRGRRYKVPKSLLIVVGRNEGIATAARNLVGVDVSTVDKLNVELLAPGGHAGRLTIWSLSAIEELRKKFG
ncbi:MAG: 50S ribosomal protein L4 [Thermoprotei archaeon]|nr:MAG: 50S ribosomal protein L4 [Thermoprotei archaeon]